MRRGFTLVEIMLALAISGMVVLLVRSVLDQTVDATARIAGEQAEQRRELAARTILTRAFGSIEIGSSGAAAFAGRSDSVTFTAFEHRGRGSELGHISLGWRDGWLTLTRDGQPAALLPALAVTFDYLLAEGADSEWRGGWHSPSSAPVAVRIRLLRSSASVDTLLFVIGMRG